MQTEKQARPGHVQDQLKREEAKPTPTSYEERRRQTSHAAIAMLR